MRLEDPPRERRRFELIAAVMGVVMGATAIGFFAIVILAADEPPPAPSPTATPSAPAATPVTEGVALTEPVDLRSGPASDVAIVTRLAMTEPIRVVGRSADGEWLVIGPEGRPDITGWVPIASVTGIDAGDLPVIADPGAPGPVQDATLSPDLPDLIITRGFSQQNQLWVEVLNQGVADAEGDFRVAVDGGPEVTLDVKPGEPLRPGQLLAAAVPGAYLQLRTSVSIHLLPVAARPEEDTENNTWTGIVGPDAPNDLEIVEAASREPDRRLVVTLRNNSPIPVAGTFTVSVREVLPGTALLGRQRFTAVIPSGETYEVEFPDLIEVDLTRVTARLSSDGIDDAVLANNTYPR